MKFNLNSELQASYTKANTLDNEQEALQAQAKAKTEELRVEMDGMDGTMRSFQVFKTLDSTFMVAP